MDFVKLIEYNLKKIITSILHLFFKQPGLNPNPPFNRILFLRYGHIGDMILSLPVFRACRTKNPDAQIDVVCDAINAIPVKENKIINNVHFYEKGLVKIIRLLWKLRKEKYDYICNLTAYPSLTFGLLARVIGPNAIRAAGDQQQYSFFYNRLIEVPPKTEIHMIKRLFQLSGDIAGTEISHIDIPWLTPSVQVEKQAIELYMNIISETNLKTDDPHLVFVNLSTGLERREWPEEKYIQFLQTAVYKYSDRIDGWGIITAPNEPDKAYRVVKQLNIPSVVQIPSTEDFIVMMSLLRHCYLLITPDTAFTHAASAMGTPVLVLMIGENVTTWEPVEVQHQIVVSDNPLKLKDLPIEDVIEGLDELLKKL